MSSRYTLALTFTLACSGLALGQAPSQAPTSYQGRVGKVITVQEANRPAERCVVLEAWEMADGNIAMQSRSLQTNLLVTVVEQARSKADDRFLIYRWTSDGLPPNGCPVAVGMRSMTVTKNLPASQRLPAPTVVQADAKSAAPGAGVVQASATTSAANRAAEAKPITHELPRVIQQGQPRDVKPMPAPPGAAAPAPVVSSDGTVGRLITVAEHGKAAEQCVVLEVTRLPDGSEGMKVQSLCTGEIIMLSCCADKCKSPIQCFLDRFRCSRCCKTGCELVCEPCPCPVECVPCPPCPVEKLVVLPREKHAVLPKENRVVQPKGKLVAPPKEKQPVAAQPKADMRKSWGPGTKVDKSGTDPLFPPTEPAEKVADAKPAEKPKELPKVAEKPGEQPKVAQKPIEQPKLPTVNPKDTATKPTPPAETKIVNARPLSKAGVMVPVPLVPLTTTDARPNVPPPQPVTRPFETLESRSVIKADAEPVAPMLVPAAQGHKASPVVQANVNGQQNLGYQPRMPNCNPCTGHHAVTGWTSGPYKPVTEVPSAIEGVKRASHDQDPITTENTVYLMTVLQSSGTPSQREWAANRLCKCDARVAPYVTETLMTVAKSDPAPLVRVACIQSLVKLQAKASPVLDMLQRAKMDRDPRVVDEAEIALSVLVDAKSEINQAGLKAKR